MRWIAMIGIAAICVSGLRGEEAAAPERSPEEIIAELDGVVVPREKGGWLQLKMEGVRLTIRFYDAKAKQMAPDVDRAVVRFKPTTRKQEFRVLIPWSSDPMTLSHGQPVRHPHVFVMFVSLFVGDSSEAVESYRINYPAGWQPEPPSTP